MLDYSIRAPLASSISPDFYVWIGRGGVIYHGTRAEILSSILPGQAFSSTVRNNSHISCYLLSNAHGPNAWPRLERRRGNVGL
jgi:hypothetical protein